MTSALRRIGIASVAAAAIGSTLLLPAQSFGATVSTVLPAPTLTAPANDPTESTPLKDVVLQWDAVPGATSYQVDISPNDTFTNNKVTLPDGGVTENTLYEMPISLPHGSYFWRVRAEESSASGAWSAPFQFLREWDASTTPSGSFSMLTAPPETGTASPLFSWTPVQDASEYLVSVSENSGFPAGATTFNCITDATSLYPYKLSSSNPENVSGSCFTEADLINDTTYYWRVQPFDDSTAKAVTGDTVNDPAFGCASNLPECDGVTLGYNPKVTGTGAFVFQAPAAGTVSDNTPVTGLNASWHTAAGSTDCNSSTDGGTVDASIMCPTTPTFSWDPVAGANYYLVHVWTDPDESNTYRAYETPYTTLTPRDLFLDNQDYRAYTWTVTPGTCVNSATDDTCENPSGDPGSTGTTPTCPTGSGDSGPTIKTVAASSVDLSGKVQGGQQESLTITGSNFQSDACVLASAGTISDVTVVSDSEITATWNTPIESADTKVTFTVTNPDGSVSAPSDAITVLATSNALFQFADESQPASFSIQTGTVNLSSPANNADVSAKNLTYKWSDYLNSGGDKATEAENYDLQIATDPNFNNIVDDVNDIDLTQYTDPGASLTTGTYYWRVAPIDESGNLLNWSAARVINVDATAPTIKITTKSGGAVDAPVKISSTEPVTGVTLGSASPTFQLVDNTTGALVPGTLKSTGTKTWSFVPAAALATGGTYGLAILGSVTDAADNSAVASKATFTTTTKADNTSAGWKFSKGWKTQTSSSALGGTFVSGSKGHTATITVVGNKVSIYGCKAPNYGTETIAVDGKTVLSASMKQTFTKCGVLIWTATSKKTVEQTLTIKVTKGTGTIDELKV